MKHPKKEQWLEFLYGEATEREAQEYRAHLGECADCARLVEEWRGTMGALDSWRTDAVPRLVKSDSRWMRWAAAAAIFMAVGIAIGASVRGQPEVAALERSLQKMAEESAATRALINELAQRVEKDQAAALAAFRQLDQRRVSDMVELRRDLERVAVATDASLKLTQSQLVQLASFPTGQEQ